MSPEVTITGRDQAGNQGSQAVVYSVIQPPQLPLQMPDSAHAVYENYGMCQHTNFQTTVYQYQNALIDRLADMGVHKFRSMYAHNLPKNTEAINRARLRGMKWHATVMTIDSTRAEINARITHLANNAADLVTHLEGINEPNEGTWVAATADRQYWMHVAVRKNPILRARWLDGRLKIGSPSMHDIKLDNSDGQHWIQFGERLVTVDADDPDFSGQVKAKEFCQFVNAHGYQGGGAVDRNRQRRVDYARAEFGNIPIIFSETGYQNAIGPNPTAGHEPVPESISAIYDSQIIFDFWNAGLGAIDYEALDDPDPGEQNIVEGNFGDWEVDPSDPAANPDTAWIPKLTVAKKKAILTWLRSGPHTPTAVRLRVTKPSDVRTTLVQRPDGSTRLYAFRYGTIYDTGSNQPITVPPVNIVVEDVSGSRNISVGPEVKAIDIAVTT
jgi:hypothetical protein